MKKRERNPIPLIPFHSVCSSLSDFPHYLLIRKDFYF
jgi:hypothetical protein